MHLTYRHSIATAVSVASLILGSSISAHAQTSFTALYNFTGAAGTQASQPVTSGVPSTLAFGDIVRGSDLVANAGANSINSHSLSTTAGFTTASLDPNAFYGFTITPNSGTYSLATISFTDQRSGTGPTSFSVRSSLDGFTTDLLTYSYAVATTTGSQTVNLASVSAFQSLSAPVTIEIFGWAPGGTGSAGTYRLTSPNSTSGLTVSGAVTAATGGGGGAAAPEPAAIALILSGAGTTGLALLRRRKK